MRKGAQLLSVENTTEFKSFIENNLEVVAKGLRRRENLLEVCKAVLLSCKDYSEEQMECAAEILEKIKKEAQKGIFEAEQEFVAFSMAISKKLGVDEVGLNVDIESLNPQDFIALKGKDFKEAMKSAVWAIRAESRKSVKDAQEKLNIRKLKTSDMENDEYLNSLNFKYVAGLNEIYSKAACYSQIAEETIAFVAAQNQDGVEKE